MLNLHFYKNEFAILTNSNYGYTNTFECWAFCYKFIVRIFLNEYSLWFFQMLIMVFFYKHVYCNFYNHYSTCLPESKVAFCTFGITAPLVADLVAYLCIVLINPACVVGRCERLFIELDAIRITVLRVLGRVLCDAVFCVLIICCISFVIFCITVLLFARRDSDAVFCKFFFILSRVIGRVKFNEVGIGTYLKGFLFYFLISLLSFSCNF